MDKMLQDIANIFLKTNSRLISQTDLFSLPFWDTYGLADKKLPFVASLCKSGLLLTYVSDEGECYQLAYNLFDDFICAKTIVSQHTSKEEIQKYLCDTVLDIREGNIHNYNNLDTCVIVLSLLAEVYGMELVDTIAQNIESGNCLDDFSKRYLMSFIWRKAKAVNKDTFLQFIRTFPVV